LPIEIELLGMAIIIEQEKRKIQWFKILLTLAVIAAILSSTYYLFFAPLPLIEKVLPQNLQSIKDISNIQFKPEDVINNPKFQILKQYANPIVVGSVGKSNPFAK